MEKYGDDTLGPWRIGYLITSIEVHSGKHGSMLDVAINLLNSRARQVEDRIKALQKGKAVLPTDKVQEVMQGLANR